MIKASGAALRQSRRDVRASETASTALTPIAIFLFIMWWDLPVATVMLIAALVTLIAPTVWNKVESGRNRLRQAAMKAFGSVVREALQGGPML